jgi:endonuclease/exonuclease/phosphatase (EEP) superfamily protein YafD
MPWLLIGLLPGLLSAMLARRKWLSLALGGPTLLITLSYAPLFMPRLNPALAAGDSLKVMSYNIWGRNQHLDEAITLIKQEQPDILLLQEVTPRIMRALRTHLIDLYPDGEIHLAYEPEIGQVIISRYPVRSVESDVDNGRTQKVIVDLPIGPVAVWNAHPYAPLAWRAQQQQIAHLAGEIAAINDPLIVGGDFNTTDQTEAYTMLSRQLNNAHWDTGWGFGFSFPSAVPRIRGKVAFPSMVRIDHIFYSEHFFARQAGTLPNSGGSDHLPVVAELLLLETR